MTDMSPFAVGERIAADWADGTCDCSEEDIQAAVKSLAMKLATVVEVEFDDGAVLALAETFKEAGEAIETRLGEFIQKDVKWKRTNK